MKYNKNLAFLTSIILMSSVNVEPIQNKQHPMFKDDDDERYYPISNMSAEERHIKKGLKKFYYGDHVIYEINKKNADRKARKSGLL